mmetsp:Transcript_1758/g.5346  ORF Transcript_1758/g.5346 Transcript_1758/m.5346 type:complete len:274 (-) Transcript_1758:376-1197(-)
MAAGFLNGTLVPARRHRTGAAACGRRARHVPCMANTAIANAGNVYEARRRVMEELELIQYWEDEGNRGKTDPWAAFLRGTVCARADYIEDAVTFFKKTQQLGFIKGYEPHYRLASVLFRAGEVATSATAWDVGLQEANEMVGNLLHFGHTFAEKYAQFLPIWDGPPRALQQGICYYCVERYRDAERVLAGDLLVGSKDIGNFFFLKASMHKLDPKRATQADSYELQKVDSTSVEQLVHLYKEADRDEANKLFNEINESRKIVLTEQCLSRSCV